MYTDQPLPPKRDERISPRISPMPLGLPPVLSDPAILDLPEVIPVRRRDHPIIAWVVICGVVGLIIVGHTLSLRGGDGAGKETHSEQSTMMGTFPYRFMIGLNEMLKGSGKDISGDIKQLDKGPPEQRLNVAILVGELKGPKEARATLDSVQLPAGASARLVRLRELLQRLYWDYEKDDFTHASLTPDDAAFLEKELGWMGELALHPPGTPDAAGRQAVLAAARRTAVCVPMFGLGMLFAGFLGLVSIIFLTVGMARGKVVSAIESPVVNGNLYAETFALWFVAFLGFSVVVAAVMMLVKIPSGIEILLAGSPHVFALSVLAWPVLRGVSWSQVRREIGLTKGAGVGWEVLYGIRTYLSALPLAAVALIVVVILAELLSKVSGGQGAPPSHPLTESLAHPTWITMLQVLILASVIAPLSEETMFRGVLYRHMREATWGWQVAASFFISAMVNSFIFAIIHPQGLLGVPLLMSLACAFTAAREIRGTLLPAMVAHGLNNSVVLIAVSILFGD